MTQWADLDALRPAVAADVQVVTSDGKSIAAHSFVLVRWTSGSSLLLVVNSGWIRGS